jgi:hypothetical protein
MMGIFICGYRGKVLQSNLFFDHHFSEVNETVTHTAESSVDTAIG